MRIRYDPPPSHSHSHHHHLIFSRPAMAISPSSVWWVMSSSLSLLRPIGRTDGHKRNNNNTTRLAGSSGSGAVVNYRHVSLVFHRVLFSFSSSSSAVQQQQQQNDALHLESSTIIRRTARHKYHRDRNDTLLLLFYPLLDSRTLIVLHPFSFFSLKEPKT